MHSPFSTSQSVGGISREQLSCKVPIRDRLAHYAFRRYRGVYVGESLDASAPCTGVDRVRVNRIGSVDLDDSVADRVEREVGDRVQIELAHQVCPVSLGCLHTQAEGNRDFFCGLALGDELDHFTFPWR